MNHGPRFPKALPDSWPVHPALHCRCYLGTALDHTENASSSRPLHRSSFWHHDKPYRIVRITSYGLFGTIQVHD